MSHRPGADPQAQIRRVLAALVAGRSTRENATAEEVSVRRAQQGDLGGSETARGRSGSDSTLLQIARLEQTLDTIGAEIDAGNMRSIYAYLMAPDQLSKLGSDAFYLANAAFRDTADVEALEERCRRLDVARKLITAHKTPRRAGETGRAPTSPPPQVFEKTRNREIADAKAS